MLRAKLFKFFVINLKLHRPKTSDERVERTSRFGAIISLDHEFGEYIKVEMGIYVAVGSDILEGQLLDNDTARVNEAHRVCLGADPKKVFS